MREEGEALAASSPPRRLACIELGSAERATCATISPCGNFAACSSPEHTSLFAITCSTAAGGASGSAGEAVAEEANVARLRVPGGLPAASALQFAAAPAAATAGSAAQPAGLHSTTLLVAALDGRLMALEVDVSRSGELAAAAEVPLPAVARAADEAQAATQHTACTAPHAWLCSFDMCGSLCACEYVVALERACMCEGAAR